MQTENNSGLLKFNLGTHLYIFIFRYLVKKKHPVAFQAYLAHLRNNQRLHWKSQVLSLSSITWNYLVNSKLKSEFQKEAGVGGCVVVRSKILLLSSYLCKTQISKGLFYKHRHNYLTDFKWIRIIFLIYVLTWKCY